MAELCMLGKGDAKPDATTNQDVGGLVDQFTRGGFEAFIRSWIGTGKKKPITKPTASGPWSRDHRGTGERDEATA